MGELQIFIQAYRDTWNNILRDTEGIGALTSYFHVPCSMVGAEGAVSVLGNTEALRNFLESRFDGFRQEDVVKTMLWGIEVHTLADHSALVTVNWELRRADDSTERTYRACYNVVRASEGWRILLLTYQGAA